ncbi:MAG: domain S-box protein [Chloroflexi bacterium]|nr:domain S-box protein [Chloroflexota bacterium]
MSRPLQVLILEDRPDDVELLVLALEQAGLTCLWERVETERDYLQRLDTPPDIILADYSLPQFNALQALRHLQRRDLDIPFIVLTGTVSEDATVECMQEGAADYLLKDRLTRLGPAVERALSAKRARDEKRSSERLARSTLDSLPEHVAILDETGTIITVNRAWRMFADQIGLEDPTYGVGSSYVTAGNTIHGEDQHTAAAIAASIQAILAGLRDDWISEYASQVTEDQGWFEVRICRFVEPGPRYAIVSHRTITDRKRSEDALRASEQRLRTVIANAPIILWAVDAGGRYTLCEGPELRDLGYEPGALVGGSIWEVLRPFPDAVAEVQRAFAGEEGVVTVGHTHGRVLETRYTLLRDDHGASTGLIGVASDVTDRVRASEEQARLAAIVDSSEDAIISTSAAGTIESWNAGASRLYGYTESEAIGRPISMLMSGDRLGEQRDILRRISYGERIANHETVRQARNGQAIEVSLSVSPIADVAGRISGAASIERDITERNQAQRELERARRVAEELAQLREERAREAQAAAEVGALLSSVLVPSELYQRVLEQVARIVPCDYADVREYEDGWVVVTASWGEPILKPGMRLFPVFDAERRWQPPTLDKPVYIPDTEDLDDWIHFAPRTGDARIRSMIAVPLLLDDKPIGSFTICSRVPNYYSERHLQRAIALGERVTQALRNAHLFSAEQARARAAEELARIRNDFVASTSHELRTPLTAILGFAELLEGRWAKLSDDQRLLHIGRIVQAANRQLRLVQDLLRLNTLDNGVAVLQHQPLTISLTVQQAAEEVRVSYREQQIVLSGPDDVTVDADHPRLLEIMCNLLDNAAKYSPEGSAIHASWHVENQVAIVRVQDHGPGIPPDGQKYLFTRFGRVPGSRIRAGHVGTGLGLYLGQQLARAMGGDLDLEATGPQGSTFRLQLPCSTP